MIATQIRRGGADRSTGSGRRAGVVPVLAAVGLIAGLAGSARALPRDCPPGYAWDANQGSCIKKDVTPRQSPAQKYYRAVDLINGTKKRRARPAYGLTLLRQSCRQRYGRACTLLGFLYLNGRHVKASNDQALKFYASACRYGDSNGCIGAADIHSRGVLGKVDHAASLPLLESACKLKNGKGCYELALKYWDALGTKSDVKRARELFAKAAGLLKDDCPKNGPSCHLIGVLYQSGRGVKRDYTQAFAAFKAGCDARSGDACYELAGAFKHGRGTKRDRDQAEATYDRACHQFDNASACHDAGVLLVEGTVKPEDRRRVMRYGERACQLDKRSCDVIAYLYGTGKGGIKDDVKAVKWYTAACDHGSRVACYSLAARHYNGLGTPKSMREALRLYQRSCDRGYGPGCRALGRFYHRGLKDGTFELQRDLARAYALYRIGCLRRDADACYWQAFQLQWGETGTTTKKQPERARYYYAQSCRFENGVACARLGQLYLRGHGTRKNPRSARYYFQRGCRMKSWTACQELGLMHYRGDIGGKNNLQAALAFEKACRYGAEQPCGWIDGVFRKAGTTAAQNARAVASMEAACRASDPNEKACYTLAGLYAYGGFITNKNPTRAFQLFDEGCKRKHQDSCVQLAHMYRQGIGVVQDADKAKQLFTEQCNGSAPASCAWLGIQLWDEKKHKKAVPLFQRACDKKDAVACNMLGFAHYTGQGTVWDVNAAAKAYERGCTLQLPVACNNVGELYEHGISFKKDLVKALEFYRKACTPADNSGCVAIARFHHKGLGGLTVDLEKAQREYERGCNDKDAYAEACRGLADIASVNKSKSQRDIAILLQKSLSLATEQAKSNPYGKYVLGTLYRDGIAVVRSAQKALDHFIAACDAYDPLGCYHAGKLQLGVGGLKPSYEAAAVRFSRACAAGIDDACTQATEARRLAAAPPKPPEPVKPTPKPLPLKPKPKGGCGCDSGDGGGGGLLGLLLLGLVCAASLRRRAGHQGR